MCIILLVMSLDVSTRVLAGEVPRPLSAHQQLKSATAAAHARVDGMMGLDRPWTMARYQGFLRAMHAVLATQAPGVSAHLADGRVGLIDTAADRLASDLAAVGATPPASSADTPQVADEAAAFGAAYVVLGSHLGGPFIARVLRDALALGPDRLTYLEPPMVVAPQWRAFLAALERWRMRATAEQWAGTIGAAVATFAAVETALRHEGVA